jgi:general secretion pathway protein C
MQSLSGYRLLMTVVGKESMVLVAIPGGKKNRFVSRGEMMDGFRLTEVGPDYAVFEKDGKSTILRMKKEVYTPPLVKPKLSGKKEKNQVESVFNDQIQQEDGRIYIPKELLSKMNSLKEIFRRISIMPKRDKKGKKLEGFVITRVKKGSVFEKMGLRPRDIIVKVDGKPLQSEADAFAYFNRLSSLNALSLTIRRNNKEKVLKYEIY